MSVILNQLKVANSLTMLGGIYSSTIEALRIYQDSGYISIYNSANSIRTGYIQANAGSDMTIGAENGALLQFYVEGSMRAAISTAGYFGIGTTTPSCSLDVIKSQNSATFIQVQNPNTNSNASASLIVSNGSYSGGYTLYGYNFTTTNAAMQNRGVLASPFIQNYVSGQHYFWQGTTGAGSDPTAANQVFGITTGAKIFHISQSYQNSHTAMATDGAQTAWRAATVTNNTSSAGSTVTSAVFHSFDAAVLAATNTGITTTNAATIYINGGPYAGTNQTITNSWGLWNVGKTRLDGTLITNGSVGIGTSSPARLLEINSISSNYHIRLGAGTVSTDYTYDIGRNGSDGYLYFYGNQNSNQGFVFTGIAREQMRIITNGNVLIGTQSDNGNRLQISGSASFTGSGFFGSNAGTGDASIEIGAGRSADGNAYLDLTGDTTYTDYGLRVMRQPGANSLSQIIHRGTSILQLNAQDGGQIRLSNNSGDILTVWGTAVGINNIYPQHPFDVRGAMHGTYPIDIGQLGVYSSDSFAINKGGVLSFGGKYSASGGIWTTWCSIAALKENATDGDYGAYLAFHTRPNGNTNQERLRITSTGKVGIGTTIPNANFVVQNGSGTSVPSLGSSGGHFQLQNGTYGLLAGVSTSGYTWMQAARTDGTATAYNIILQLNGGNVGIGTSSPSTRTHVYGTLTVDAAGQSGNNFSEGIRLGAASNGYSIITFGADPASATGAQANQWWIGKDGGDNGFNIWGNSSGNAFHILSSGYIGIGTNSPSYKLDVNGDIRSTSKVYDSIGNVREIPQNSQTSGSNYSLVATDNGKHISITSGGVTVPSGIFSAGQVVTIYNNSGSNQTITQGGSVTLRQAGTANTGNRVLAQYGIATVLCVASNVFVISGSGLS